MLWKKESTKPNALYVDIIGKCAKPMMDTPFAVNTLILGCPHINKAITVKNDALAQAKRIQGNSAFAKNDLVKAMELYNESLCLAPQRSENIALAYANRSACFLKLKMYTECLVDIELAKKAGYPAEKISKLNEREASCLKEINNCKQQTNPPIEQLSYEPNENFPSMANVLNVIKDGAGKYSVIANEDIDVGQTVAVEKALFGCVFQHFGLKCNICLKSSTNLIPCKKCTVATFCSAECQSSRIHEYECGIQPGSNSYGYVTTRELRYLLTAINLFPNVDALMDFVEQRMKDDDLLPANMKDEISQYYAYLKQPHCNRDLGDGLGICIAPVYKLAMGIPAIKQMFRMKKHERFLQHLIAQHYFITPESARDPRNSHDQHIQVNVMMDYFQQSCSPNMLSIPSNGYLTFITFRPIKKGEELYDFSRRRERFCSTAENFCVNEECVCDLCTNGYVDQPLTSKQYRKIYNDPNYEDILELLQSPEVKTFDDDELRAEMKKCVIFLKKNGRVAWGNELEYVMMVYEDLTRNYFRKILR